MATIPDWKLQLLARRRQEEAAVRGREQAERERLSQMPAWKRGLLERRKAKHGLSPGEQGPVPGTVETGPPDPDESAVLLEAIGPVRQNRFIRLERQQQQQQLRNEELLAERRPGPLEVREGRPSPWQTPDQSPKGPEPRDERLSPPEATEKRLGGGGAWEASPRPLEPRDWRPGPEEAGGPSCRPAEARTWRFSPGETPEHGLRRTEVVESKLSPRESGNQKPGLTEPCKWRLDCGEALEQSSQWRPRSGEDSKDVSKEPGTNEDRPIRRPASEDTAGLPETPWREAPESGPGQVEAAEQEQEAGLVEDGDLALKPTGGWKWTLNSGKVRERTPMDIEIQTQKPEPSELAEKRLGAPEVEPGEGEPEEEEVGAQSRPLSTLQNHCSGPSPLPPEDAGTGGPGLQEEEAVEPRPSPSVPLSPPPPAPPVPQASGDPLMNRLFYGVKSGVGGPRRSGHTFTVNPRRSAPPAAPATPAGPATADAAAPGAGKKRYPTAEEILVLGGYLRLSRSCLVKGSPERHHKQLKISFSETALETMYQYPSESSVLEELGPEPEAPSAPGPPAAQPDDEDEEEELLLLQRELQGGLRTKALIVDESCRR
ncbi:phostensin [Echinops telfairi]|uniref:Phostensin n=1 Tax=Echinops telfairi TaxID=9371 RepID=A0ABM0IZX4_ECHTE|nr:phostensin [Echinops telfairi]